MKLQEKLHLVLSHWLDSLSKKNVMALEPCHLLVQSPEFKKNWKFCVSNTLANLPLSFNLNHVSLPRHAARKGCHQDSIPLSIDSAAIQRVE
jgi:hypothetical protein